MFGRKSKLDLLREQNLILFSMYAHLSEICAVVLQKEGLTGKLEEMNDLNKTLSQELGMPL